MSAHSSTMARSTVSDPPSPTYTPAPNDEPSGCPSAVAVARSLVSVDVPPTAMAAPVSPDSKSASPSNVPPAPTTTPTMGLFATTELCTVTLLLFETTMPPTPASPAWSDVIAD
jgi:hypothetical protein